MKIKVKNLVSVNGNAVPNQFEITTERGKYFQSYDSTIIFIPLDQNRKTELDERYWDYSITTSKYRNRFLGENKPTTLKKIESGEYILTNLN